MHNLPSLDEYLRNRKHFPCFHTVTETLVEVWENEKLKWEHESARQVFPRYFEFSQTSTSVSTHGNIDIKAQITHTVYDGVCGY